MTFTVDASAESMSLFATEAEEDAFIKEANLATLMEDYRPSAFSKTRKSSWDNSENSKGVKNCNPEDILIGRFVSHPGNVLARKVIVSNRACFQAIEDTEERKMATDALVGFFERKGCRFLECNDKRKGGFKFATYDAVMEKFRKSLRETGFRNNTSHRATKKKASHSRPVRKVDKKEIVAKAKNYSDKKTVPTKVKRTVKVSQSRSVAVQPAAWSKVQVGAYLGIYWPMDDVYYPGTVVTTKGAQVGIRYDDGEHESVDLSLNKFVTLGKIRQRSPRGGPNGKENWAKAKTSPENSVKTLESSDQSSEDGTMDDVAVSVEGSFAKAVPVAVSSLASFLAQKLQKK